MSGTPSPLVGRLEVEKIDERCQIFLFRAPSVVWYMWCVVRTGSTLGTVGIACKSLYRHCLSIASFRLSRSCC